jgi:hypothetical protein
VVILSYQHALTPVFRYLVPLLAVGLIFAILLPDRQLTDTKTDSGTPGAQPTAEMTART